MIKLFVCADEEIGRLECASRGWVRIAANRFVDEVTRDDIRVVRRFTDFSLSPGLVMVRGSDFADNPQSDKFERLAAQGHVRWDDSRVD